MSLPIKLKRDAWDPSNLRSYAQIELHYEKLARDQAGGAKAKAALVTNHLYWLLYSKEEGKYKKLRRRQWIERYVHVIAKKGRRMVPFILNPPQRQLMARIYRMERAGVPIRIIILKARQLGFSTLVQAIIAEYVFRTKNARALVIAHRKDTAALLLEMTHRTRRYLKREGGDKWDFENRSSSRSRYRIGEPFESEIEITSAEVAEPGHGDTCGIMHMSEGSRWPDATTKRKGVLQIVPDDPETMIFDESTANGDTGAFRDEFWKAWNERDLSLTSHKRTTAWQGMFFPWQAMPEYRWTNTMGSGRELPEDLVQEIKDTITDEEKVLLETTYFERGVGWRKVDYDQLAWRRFTIQDKCGGSLRQFHEQYPAFPEEAFLASGQPLYDPAKIRALLDLAAVNPYIWRGTTADDSAA